MVDLCHEFIYRLVDCMAGRLADGLLAYTNNASCCTKRTRGPILVPPGGLKSGQHCGSTNCIPEGSEGEVRGQSELNHDE